MRQALRARQIRPLALAHTVSYASLQTVELSYFSSSLEGVPWFRPRGSIYVPVTDPFMLSPDAK
jgi:hypothetical protein